jgi:hypothetical protein
VNLSKGLVKHGEENLSSTASPNVIKNEGSTFENGYCRLASEYLEEHEENT